MQYLERNIQRQMQRQSFRRLQLPADDSDSETGVQLLFAATVHPVFHAGLRFLGLFLARQRRGSGQGHAWGHHFAHNDNSGDKKRYEEKLGLHVLSGARERKISSITIFERTRKAKLSCCF